MFGSFGKKPQRTERRDSFSECSDVHSDFHGSEHGAFKTKMNLKFRDTISELYDDNEKNAIFRSSMKKGGAMHEFNQTKMMGLSFSGSPNNKEMVYPPEERQPAPPTKGKGFVFEKKDHPKPEYATAFRQEIPEDFSGLKQAKPT